MFQCFVVINIQRRLYSRWHGIERSVVSVCLCLSVLLKENGWRLSRPKLLAGPQRALTLKSKGQRSRSRSAFASTFALALWRTLTRCKALQRGLTGAEYVHCLNKNTPNIFRCNSSRRCWILIIFGRNVLLKTCNRRMVYFPTSPN